MDPQFDANSSPRKFTRREVLAAGFGLAAAGVLVWVGPHPVRLASGRSGDVNMLARVEPYLAGLNRVALAYIDEDGVRYAGFGADERTPFEIGSVSKTFCAAVLMDMVSAGEVNLETTVAEMTDATGSELADVTMRELASHTAGLPDFTPKQVSNRNLSFGFLHADGANQNAAEVMSDVLSQHLVDRGTFSYSTAGIALLGQLLAVRAGVPYDQLLGQRILQPLSLDDTYLPVTRSGLREDWTKGLLGGRPAEPWTLNGLAPGGGMWSTCADLATWIQLTRDGRQPGSSGLAPVAPAPIRPWMPDAQVAIGWILATTPRGEDLVFHNGLTGSHHSYVGYCPRTGRGLAYVVNSAPAGSQLLRLQGDMAGSLLDDGLPS